jgi:hypothetical protein
MPTLTKLIDAVRDLIQDLVQALSPNQPQVAVQPVRSDEERIFRA